MLSWCYPWADFHQMAPPFLLNYLEYVCTPSLQAKWLLISPRPYKKQFMTQASILCLPASVMLLIFPSSTLSSNPATSPVFPWLFQPLLTYLTCICDVASELCQWLDTGNMIVWICVARLPSSTGGALCAACGRNSAHTMERCPYLLLSVMWQSARAMAPYKGHVRSGQLLEVKDEVQVPRLFCRLLWQHVHWDTWNKQPFFHYFFIIREPI